MSEPTHEAPLEGWYVPQRWGLLIAIAPPLLLAAVIIVAGHFYDRDLKPLHRQPVTTFPAPGIETFIHDGHGDPERAPPRPPADPTIAAAKRAVAAGGIQGWSGRR